MIRRLRLPVVLRRLTSKEPEGRHRAPDDEPRVPGEATRPLYRDDPDRAPRLRMTGLVRALNDPEEGR